MIRLPSPPPFAARLVLLQAAIKLALHLTVNLRTPYGLHRDELLYLGMGGISRSGEWTSPRPSP